MFGFYFVCFAVFCLSDCCVCFELVGLLALVCLCWMRNIWVTVWMRCSCFGFAGLFDLFTLLLIG